MPCTPCGRAFHAGCVRLRAIPFRGSTRADRRYRELFVKRYFGDWMCKECERRPAVVCAPPVCASCAARRRAWRSWRRRVADVPRVRTGACAREGKRGPGDARRGRSRAADVPPSRSRTWDSRYRLFQRRTPV